MDLSKNQLIESLAGTSISKQRDKKLVLGVFANRHKYQLLEKGIPEL